MAKMANMGSKSFWIWIQSLISQKNLKIKNHIYYYFIVIVRKINKYIISNERKNVGNQINVDHFYYIIFKGCICTRVSNRTGQCNFSGQRDRSSFIVPGQRDNGTSSKSYQGLGRAGTACQNLGRDMGQDGTVWDFDSLSRPAGQTRTKQKRTF